MFNKIVSQPKVVQVIAIILVAMLASKIGYMVGFVYGFLSYSPISDSSEVFTRAMIKRAVQTKNYGIAVKLSKHLVTRRVNTRMALLGWK